MSHLAPTQFASVPEHGRRLDRPRSCPSVCGARPFVPAPLRSTAGPGAHRLRHHLLCRQRLHLPARGEPLAGTLAVALPGAAHSPRRRLLVHRLRARQHAGVRVAPQPHAPSSHSSRLCPQAVTLPRWYAWQHCRELQDMSTFQKCARSMQAQRRGSRPPCARTDSARWQPWVGRGSTCAPYPDVPKPDGSCCTATGCACTRARPASVTTLVYTQNAVVSGFSPVNTHAALRHQSHIPAQPHAAHPRFVRRPGRHPAHMTCKHFLHYAQPG